MSVRLLYTALCGVSGDRGQCRGAEWRLRGLLGWEVWSVFISNINLEYIPTTVAYIHVYSYDTGYTASTSLSIIRFDGFAQAEMPSRLDGFLAKAFLGVSLKNSLSNSGTSS